MNFIMIIILVRLHKKIQLDELIKNDLSKNFVYNLIGRVKFYQKYQFKRE